MSTPPDTTSHDWPEYQQTTKGQFDAATPEISAWVSANAGSGKTKVLIDRVARLLLNGVKPDAILCVTYTKAAASEMQARLFKRLGGWCVSDDHALARELAGLQGRQMDDYDEEALGKARELFALALETPGGLRIETIHAFCGRLLRRFPLEAGAPPGFRELDDVDSGRLWELAVMRLGADVAKGDPDLSDALHTAVMAAGGNGLAAPLRALLNKQADISAFIAHAGGVGDAILALQNALDAPDDTVDELIAYAMGPALPRAVLKNLLPVLLNGAKTDIATGELIEDVLLAKDPAQAFALYQGLFLTSTGAFRKSNPYTVATAKACPEIVDLLQVKSVPEGSEVYRMRMLTEKISARQTLDRSAALLRLSHIVFSDYARQKRRRAALDFDDLITSAASLLTRRAAAQWVLWKLDGGLSHVLLDEAQDTSPQQWSLLNALTEDFFAGAGVERDMDRTLFVVGDEKQSIYSFQGADPEKFLSQRQQFIAQSAELKAANKTPDMLMSFRSAPEVLAFVDRVFDTDQFDGEAPFSLQPPEDQNLMQHLAFRRADRGCVELWPMEPLEQEDAAIPWDAPIGQKNKTSSRARLATRIALWVRELITDAHAITKDGVARTAQPGDILILVRTRGPLFDDIINALKLHGLPVAGADRINLLDSLPVQDLLNLIRFVLTPEDDLTLAEILTGPFGGLEEDAHLYPLAHGRGRASLWSRLTASDDPAFTDIREFLDQMLARRHLPPFEFLTMALETTQANNQDGWDQILARLGAPAKDPILALLDRAAVFDATGPASLQLFLTRIEQEGGQVKRELSGPQGEVRVMTVHGSKGLEAPIVILPDTCSAPKKGVDNNLMVSDSSDQADLVSGMPIWSGPASEDTPLAARLRLIADARALREHRRLLYVALTRAQDRLLVCGAWMGKSKTGYAAGSWYDVCERAMRDLTDKGAASMIELDETHTVYRLGAVSSATGSADAPIRFSAPSAPDWLRTPAPAETRAVRYTAPSGLLGEEPAVLAPFGGARPRRLQRGRLIHTLLQTLPDLPPEDRRTHAMRFLARDTEFEPHEHEEMYAAAVKVLDDPMFDPIFAPGGRAEAPIVGGNDARLPPGLLINGRVDRLVITDDSVLIVDFKTDRPAPARVEDVGAAYTAQMAAYRAVLESAYPDRQVRCALVWTDGPKFMELSAPAMDAALDNLRALA